LWRNAFAPLNRPARKQSAGARRIHGVGVLERRGTLRVWLDHLAETGGSWCSVIHSPSAAPAPASTAAVCSAAPSAADSGSTGQATRTLEVSRHLVGRRFSARSWQAYGTSQILPTGFDFAQLDSISPNWIRFAQLDSIRPFGFDSPNWIRFALERVVGRCAVRWWCPREAR
jgi:hypothetical protein